MGNILYNKEYIYKPLQKVDMKRIAVGDHSFYVVDKAGIRLGIYDSKLAAF